MSLADKLGEERPARPGKPCGMHYVFAGLSDRDADALQRTLDVPVGDPHRLSSRQISSILELEGHNVSIKTVEAHRKGACRCDSR